VGGEPAREGAYPWLVALFELYKSKPIFVCGGSLIDTTHVLTAAHCSLSTQIDNELHQFVTTPLSPPQVVAARRPSSLSALDDGDLLTVRRIFVHPLFDGSSTDYDVAVWELAKPVHLREYPRVLRSPEVMDWLSALRLPARILGYGARSAEDEGSEALMQVEVPLIPRAECQLAYAEDAPSAPSEELISERMICAAGSEQGEGPCYGDSGGPLLVGAAGKAPLLVGVVSWGSACGEGRRPDVYANVAALADYVDACRRGRCESRAPERDCDFGYLDCDGAASNGCETLLLSPATCGAGCGAPACQAREACIISQTLYCAPGKPVTPSATCVVRVPDEFGEYQAWFGLHNENEGSVQIPVAEMGFSDGAAPILTFEGLPPGFIEHATLVTLERPDAGTFTVPGPDGEVRSASITAETPDCPGVAVEPLDELARTGRAKGFRVHRTGRARLLAR
jgi:trypsin